MNNAFRHVTRVLVDPQNENVVLVSTAGGFRSEGENGIQRSTDGGQTWDSVLFAPDLYFQDLSHPVPSVCVAVGDSGVLVSTTDAGASWHWTRTQWGRLLRVSMGDSLHGVAGSTTNCPLLRTTDGGVTWDESMYLPDSIRPALAAVTSIRAFPDSSFIVMLQWLDLDDMDGLEALAKSVLGK